MVALNENSKSIDDEIDIENLAASLGFYEKRRA